MSRSRIVLMVAWGLLAAGSVAHFVQSAYGDESANADGTSSAGPPEALGFRLGTDPETSSGTDPGIEIVDGVDHAGFDNPQAWGTTISPALVATVTDGGVASRTEPVGGRQTHWFTNPTQFGGERTFLVVDDVSSDAYVKVSLPVMPNGQEGWIARSAVVLSTVTHRAEVDLSEATVTVWDGDEVVVTTGAVTGRPSTPTPLGRFFVRDIIAQPSADGDYGPWILALSGFSEVLRSFNGGLPALALHGTDSPGQIGAAISSGCVRVPNDIITTLAETVPLGTPVTVVA